MGAVMAFPLPIVESHSTTISNAVYIAVYVHMVVMQHISGSTTASGNRKQHVSAMNPVVHFPATSTNLQRFNDSRGQPLDLAVVGS